MNIYVDFDDCLCETAQGFSTLVKDLFDIDNVSDYLKKEITKEEYYNKLSEVYESELNALDEENM